MSISNNRRKSPSIMDDTENACRRAGLRNGDESIDSFYRRHGANFERKTSEDGAPVTENISTKPQDDDDDDDIVVLKEVKRTSAQHGTFTGELFKSRSSSKESLTKNENKTNERSEDSNNIAENREIHVSPAPLGRGVGGALLSPIEVPPDVDKIETTPSQIVDDEILYECTVKGSGSKNKICDESTTSPNAVGNQSQTRSHSDLVVDFEEDPRLIGRKRNLADLQVLEGAVSKKPRETSSQLKEVVIIDDELEGKSSKDKTIGDQEKEKSVATPSSCTQPILPVSRTENWDSWEDSESEDMKRPKFQQGLRSNPSGQYQQKVSMGYGDRPQQPHEGLRTNQDGIQQVIFGGRPQQQFHNTPVTNQGCIPHGNYIGQPQQSNEVLGGGVGHAGSYGDRLQQTYKATRISQDGRQEVSCRNLPQQSQEVPSTNQGGGLQVSNVVRPLQSHVAPGGNQGNRQDVAYNEQEEVRRNAEREVFQTLQKNSAYERQDSHRSRRNSAREKMIRKEQLSPEKRPRSHSHKRSRSRSGCRHKRRGSRTSSSYSESSDERRRRRSHHKSSRKHHRSHHRRSEHRRSSSRESRSESSDWEKGRQGKDKNYHRRHRSSSHRHEHSYHGDDKRRQDREKRNSDNRKKKDDRNERERGHNRGSYVKFNPERDQASAQRKEPCSHNNSGLRKEETGQSSKCNAQVTDKNYEHQQNVVQGSNVRVQQYQSNSAFNSSIGNKEKESQQEQCPGPSFKSAKNYYPGGMKNDARFTPTTKVYKPQSNSNFEVEGNSETERIQAIIKKMTTCVKCGHVSKNRKEANNHLKKEHALKLCYVCYKPLRYQGLDHKTHFLNIHAKGDDEEKAPCPICNAKTGYEGMYLHISKAHLKLFEISESETTPGHIFSQPAGQNRGGHVQQAKNWERGRFQPTLNMQRSTSNVLPTSSKIINFASAAAINPNGRLLYRKVSNVKDPTNSEFPKSRSALQSSNDNDNPEHKIIHVRRNLSFKIPKKLST